MLCCWWCCSSSIAVPFPFYHFIPLIPLSALDVGEATAPALPPTLSLHYSVHTIILFPPTWRHQPPFVSLCTRCFKIWYECITSVVISQFCCQIFEKKLYLLFPTNVPRLKWIFPSLLRAENASLETDESRIGHAVHSKPKAAASPPTHLLKAILKLHESGTACHFPLSLGGGGCIIKSEQPTHYKWNMY